MVVDLVYVLGVFGAKNIFLVIVIVVTGLLMTQ